MKTKIKIWFVCFGLLFSICSFEQMNKYGYKKELTGIKEQWHKIILPNIVFNKIKTDLSDIRIFGIKASNDTIEAPYVLRESKEKTIEKVAAFSIINQSKNEKGYYYTLALNSTEPINQIELAFKQLNFDLRISLEGSLTQNEWFSIVEDYRILSIHNALTDFHFTSLLFPKSNYAFYRLLIKTKTDPELVLANIFLNESVAGNYRKYAVQSMQVENQNKQTSIAIVLEQVVPISRVKIHCNDSVDYYRPVNIEYLTDSIKTEKGWQYNYVSLTSGTINSFEKNKFVFANTKAKRLQIIIDNQDNRPLQIDSVFVEGNTYDLIARFDEPAQYFFTYGNSDALKPQYDIENFTEKIPVQVSLLELGEEIAIDKVSATQKEPLFKNKVWLWVIISVVILVLAGFTLQMIRRR